MATFIDKHLKLKAALASSLVELELGCGPRKRSPSAIGIDRADHDCVDVVGDAIEVLKSMPPASIDKISSYHFAEHVSDVPTLMSEMSRVLKPGGRLIAIVPHFSNPYYYSDVTHQTHFGLYTMSYFAQDALFRRRVPQYHPLPLTLVAVDLGFKSSPPFYLRYGFKRLIQLLVNCTRSTQELYEEQFCWLFPCYDVQYVLVRQ